MQRPFIKYIVIILLVLIPVGTGLLARPVELRPKEKFVGGSFENILATSGASVAALVSLSAIRESPDRFSDRLWSLAWANTLEQEMGAFRIIDIDEEKEISFKDLNLVIVTRSVKNKMPDLLPGLKDYVKEGGCLIVEMPDNASKDLTGLIVGCPERWEGKVSWVNTTFFTEASMLEGEQVHTDIVPVLEGDESSSVVLKMGSNPVILFRRLGEGLVEALLYDHGLFLVSTQQGIPGEDFRVEDRWGNRKVLSPIDMLRFDPDSGPREIPVADVIERLIIGTIDVVRPLARPWYFPVDYDGAALMTHDEDWYGDDSTYMTDYEESINTSSSFFIIPDSSISSSAIESMYRSGADVGIHWNRETDRWLGIFRRSPSLDEQIELLGGKLPDNRSITACRIENFRWGSDWSRPFGILEANGIEADLTFGRGRGYLFGTGLPYHPMDKNGKPFSMWEIPFQNLPTWWGGGDVAYMSTLFSRSKNTYHEAIGALYHPQDCANQRAAYDDWVGFFTAAKETDHWIVDVGEFCSWWKDRTQMGIDTSWEGWKLSVRSKAPGDNLVLMLPKTTADGRSFVGDSYRETSVLGLSYVLVQVPLSDVPAVVEWSYP